MRETGDAREIFCILRCSFAALPATETVSVV